MWQVTSARHVITVARQGRGEGKAHFHQALCRARRHRHISPSLLKFYGLLRVPCLAKSIQGESENLLFSPLLSLGQYSMEMHARIRQKEPPHVTAKAVPAAG
jgi:hypothetical protein